MLKEKECSWTSTGSNSGIPFFDFWVLLHLMAPHSHEKGHHEHSKKGPLLGNCTYDATACFKA